MRRTDSIACHPTTDAASKLQPLDVVIISTGVEPKRRLFHTMCARTICSVCGDNEWGLELSSTIRVVHPVSSRDIPIWNYGSEDDVAVDANDDDGDAGDVSGSEDFATRYLKNNEEIIPNGRTLTVDYERIKTTNEHGRATFCRRAAFRGRSWRPFVICNELKVGDVCIFELIKENGNLLEVFIHRKSQVSLIEIS
ncbi:hypothetical protein V6N12_045632 [Hibiscus sabdariffa]|uniref:TF-B3 domain-containing protein n=1 Tax=Hibiscus sabdariffa TaxID=183260 RepID=A0ABR2G3C6_9ROSI